MRLTLNSKPIHILAFLILTLTLLIQVSPAQAAENYRYKLSKIRFKDTLRTDGKTLVWVSYGDSDYKGPLSDIYGKDLATGREFIIANEVANESNPVVSGNYVAWLVTGYTNAVWVKDLSSDEVFTLAQAPGLSPGGSAVERFDQLQLIGSRLYVQSITFQGRAGHAYITAYDLTAPDTKPQTILSVELRDLGGSETERMGQVVVTPDWIVWSINSFSNQCALFKQKIGSKEAVKIAENPIFPAVCTYNLTNIGNKIIYGGYYEAPVIHNLDTGETRQLYETNPTVKYREGIDVYEPFQTDGRYLLWRRGSIPDEFCEVLAYDLKTDSAFTLQPPCGNDPDRYHSVPLLIKDTLYWVQRTGATSYTIQSAPFKPFLPTAAQPHPTDLDPAAFYFSETGHILAGSFKDYWLKNGGLPVFGFPLTEPLQELKSDGRYYIVQYFERIRLEYHPENKGTPYEVLMGLLGRSDAHDQGLDGREDFQPVAKPAPLPANCAYFAETGHTLCGEFYYYWLSHGLDLGEPGFGLRESLALFGYPISEPFKDTYSGMVVQYFERAKFEYHPENTGTAYEVLLGRLAVNGLVKREWLDYRYS